MHAQSTQKLQPTIYLLIYGRYGDVDTSDLTANEKRMKAQWLPLDTINSLYKQLSDGKYFAAEGGEVLSETLLMQYGYDNVLAAGLFNTDCSKWRKMKPTEKSWDKFKVIFTTAAKYYSKNTTTAHQYSAANVQEMLDKRLQEYTIKAPPTPPPWGG